MLDFFFHNILFCKTDGKVSSAISICNGSVHIQQVIISIVKLICKRLRAKVQEDKPNFE